MKFKLFFSFALLIALFSCKTPKTIVETNFKSIAVLPSSTLLPDTSIINRIAPYKEIIDKEMTKKVAFSEQAIDKDIPEGPLNQLIADNVFTETSKYLKSNNSDDIDMVLLNHGGLRKSLPKGDITIGNIFELMPFDNTIAVVTFSGETMHELFDFLASKNEGHPISNASFTARNKKAENISINNKPIDLTKTYRVATSDYLTDGNDGMIFFKKAIKTELLPILIRDAIIHQLPNANLNMYKKENLKIRNSIQE